MANPRIGRATRAANNARYEQNVRIRNAYLKKLRVDARDEVAHIAVLGMNQILIQALGAMEGAALEAVLAAVDSLSTGLKNRSAGLQAIHQKAGLAAVEATVSAFQRTKLKKPYRGEFDRSDAPERAWRRYANGQLEAALKSPAMFFASPDGIAWVSKSHLDAEAPQWYRLNYGAGARGKAQTNTNFGFNGPQGSHFKILNQDIGLNIKDLHHPSRAFTMPAGLWHGKELQPEFQGEGFGLRYRPRSGGTLVPFAWLASRPALVEALGGEAAIAAVRGSWRNAGAQKKIPTQGIEAQRFLDAGLGKILETLSIGYSDLIKAWLKEASLGGGYNPRSPIAKSGGLNRRQASAVLKKIK